MAEVRSAPRAWEGEALAIALYNLHLESYALHANLANVQIRILHEDYQRAQQKDNLGKQRQSLRDRSARATQSLKKAGIAVDFMEKSGRMTKESVAQKRLQINKTRKTLTEITGKI